MKQVIIGVIAIVALLFTTSVNTTTATLSKEQLKEVVNKAENRLRGKSSVATSKVTIVRPKYTREMTLKTWSKGEDYSLTYIMTPARDQGTVYLKRLKEIWYYLPSVERNIKMPPSMMNQSWMGTDLSNDDLVRKTSLAEDFSHELLGEETIQGKACYHIKLIPHEDADVVWGKVEMWVDKTLYNVMKQEQFDEDMELVNTMKAYNVKSIGGETLPTKMEFIPADKKGQMTVMEYQSIQFNVQIPDSYFTTQFMTKVKP